MRTSPWVEPRATSLRGAEPPVTGSPALARQWLREASAELARLRRIRGAYQKTARRIARARARLALAAALLAASLAEPAVAGTPRFDNGVFGLANVGSSATPNFVDIDGDGDLDAFVGERFGLTSFFENTGTASAAVFGPAQVGAFGISNVGLNSKPELVDIDGDGDLDAFVGERYAGVLFFANTGSANAPAFAAPSANPFGLVNVGLRSAPVFVDIDGDGDLDALIGEAQGNTAFFENTGTANAPAFAAPVTNPFGLADVGERAVPSFGDLDGDGDLDALYGELNGGTFFFENTGNAFAPAFAPAQENALGLAATPYTSATTLTDIDGDGDLDVFVGEFYGLSTFFENTGTAAAPAFLAASTNPFGPFAVTRWPAPAFADLDGDGDLDAFVGEYFGSTLYFQNTGTATVPALAAPVTNPFGLATVATGSAAPTFVDLDADGDLDALIGNQRGNLLYFRNTGAAGAPAFAAPTANPFGLARVGNRAVPTFADLDDDGDLDLLVGDVFGVTHYFQNTGSASAPAFASAVTHPFGLASVGQNIAPAAVDIDGDGDVDVFVGNLNGDTLLFRNTGTASAPAFAAPQTNPHGLANLDFVATPAFADLDGDGDLDAAISGYEDRIFYFENVELDAEACSDGLDNDGDGLSDFPGDAGCANGLDTSELSIRQCDNGSDDDGDGFVDWRGDGSGDPQCVSLDDDREAPTPPQPACGIGPELLLLAPLLSAGYGRRARLTDRQRRAGRAPEPK
jgi:hypothetical protein